MYGGPGGEIPAEQKKLQEQQAAETMKAAGMLAGALWVTPIVFHFIKKQFS